MEASRQRYIEEADHLIEVARKRPENLLNSGSFNLQWRSIHQKLLDLYVEQSKKEAHCKKLQCTSHLLKKLVCRDHLNTLVVNLYPGNEGYSLLIKGRNGNDSETIRLPYEETEMLDYIDAGQLPPLIVDLLDKLQLNIFYSGCIIVELRDYRRTTDSSFDTNFILLQPTTHTLTCDVNAMTNDGRRWTQEDKFAVESELLLATTGPLCLDPSPTVGVVINKILAEKRLLNSVALKKSVRCYSQAAVNRRRKMAPYPAPRPLQLHDFVSRRRDKTGAGLGAGLPTRMKVGKTCVDNWRRRDMQLSEPDCIPVDKFAKVIEKSKLTNNNTPVVLEKFILETDPTQGKVNYSQLTILQRLSDEFYLGELYVDRHFAESASVGSTCRFPLGTKANVDKYISQFREIFTEEGRRQVKITHHVVGQAPTITYTQSIHTTTQVVQLCSPGPGGDVKRAPPIKLSLSLNTQTSSVVPQVAALQGGQTAAGAATQLTLNLQPVPSGGKPLRQLTVYASLPSRSEVATIVTAQGSSQLPTYAQATAGLGAMLVPGVGQAVPGGGAGTPPPLSASPALQLTEQRKQSESTGYEQLPDAPTFLQADAVDASPLPHPASTLAPPGGVMSHQPGSGMVAAPLAAPSVALQGLGLAGLQALQGLHTVQVSLGDGSTGITVPLSMITSNSPAGGILVSSIAPGVTASALSGAPQSRAAMMSPPASYVSMVTALPPSSGVITPVVTPAALSPNTVSSAGLVSSPQVLASPTGLLSLPIGVAGNLTQFMAAAGLKTAQGIRPGGPLFLSQIPAQLIGTRGSQASRVDPAGGLVQAGDCKQGLSGATALLTVPSLLAPGQPPLSTAQLLLAPPSLRGASPGGVQTLAAQQLLQLTPQQQQQLAVQLATQQLQIQQLQQLGKLTAATATGHQGAALQQQQQQQLQLQQQLQQRGKGKKRSSSSTATKPP